MKFAKGGYLPGSFDKDDPLLKLYPGEHIYYRDGSVWQVSEDGTDIIRIFSAEED